MKHLILGTAGHVDHGKTSLVKALTGVDTDRLPEEKARGMTIELGFTHLDLPSGIVLGVVDMPGHEKFIKHMAAGAGGVDIALLVIAADEGIMQQTEEHLEILGLLGIKQGIVALTKSDLVDDEWLAMVEEEVKERLKGTSLSGAPVIPVSSVTGAGIESLM
ncbi:MAG TPA: GTP-binding protein, partial [Bacillota bacterium]|nr:GTP-binding protein [Bacillota bacterium]